MILTPILKVIYNISVPRVGGGDPTLVFNVAELSKCSPRRRG